MNNNRWIPVNERVPDTIDDVLISNGQYVLMGWYSRIDNHWLECNPDNYYEPNCRLANGFVKAWMPLPEPYKEEEE